MCRLVLQVEELDFQAENLISDCGVNIFQPVRLDRIRDDFLIMGGALLCARLRERPALMLQVNFVLGVKLEKLAVEAVVQIQSRREQVVAHVSDLLLDWLQVG